MIPLRQNTHADQSAPPTRRSVPMLLPAIVRTVSGSGFCSAYHPTSPKRPDRPPGEYVKRLRSTRHNRHECIENVADPQQDQQNIERLDEFGVFPTLCHSHGDGDDPEDKPKVPTVGCLARQPFRPDGPQTRQERQHVKTISQYIIESHAKITPLTCSGRTRLKRCQGTPANQFGLILALELINPKRSTMVSQTTELYNQIFTASSECSCTA
jgi:hypothetical protein